MRNALLGTSLAAIILAVPAAGAAHGRLHHRRTVPRHAATARSYAARPYASRVSPTITCRYADGTPFDPDVIGGPNHVGDGGPAANLGGFDPCGF